MKAKNTSKLWEWQKKAKEGGECRKCHREFSMLTVEHIINVNFLQQTGLYDVAINDEENFDLYCHGCNHFKGGRLDMSHPKTVPLLKKYVAML